MEYHVRDLTYEDVLDVVALAKDHHAASRYADIPFAAAQVYKLCKACITLDQYHAFVLVANGATSGYLALSVDQYLFADFKIAQDMALYVRPTARSIFAFRALVNAAENWCLDNGVHSLDFSITTPIGEFETKRYGQLYRSMGYRWHGETFRREMRDG